jgi:hypothetical protein
VRLAQCQGSMLALQCRGLGVQERLVGCQRQDCRVCALFPSPRRRTL